MIPTLQLKYHKATTPHPNGLWIPADHESHRLALMHFSGGSEAIAYDRLDEIIFVAGLHGFRVIADGNPRSANAQMSHSAGSGATKAPKGN